MRDNYMHDDIEIIGASENNLKHIDVTIPKGKQESFYRNQRLRQKPLAFPLV